MILQEELREERIRLTTALLLFTARRQSSSLTAPVKVTEILTEIISMTPVSLVEVHAVVHRFTETIALYD